MKQYVTTFRVNQIIGNPLGVSAAYTMFLHHGIFVIDFAFNIDVNEVISPKDFLFCQQLELYVT